MLASEHQAARYSIAASTLDGNGTMTSRFVFDRGLLHAVHLRGLTMGQLADRAGVSSATVSAAVHGKPLNIRSEELERWAAQEV